MDRDECEIVEDLRYPEELQSFLPKTTDGLDGITTVEYKASEPSALGAERLSSPFESFVTVFKSTVGAGVVALPYAFRRAGLLNGIVGLLVIYVLSNYTLRQIVRCVRITRARRRSEGSQADLRGQELGYAEVGDEALGRLGRYLSYFSLILCQFIAVCSYLIFVSDNISEVVPVRKEWVVVLCFPLVLGMSLAKSTTYLAPTSTFGNIALTTAVISVFVYGFTHSPPRLSNVKMHNGASGFADFFGVAVFTFSAHPEILPIEFDARNKLIFYRIIDVCMFLVTILYGTFSVLAYMFFGEDTHSIIFDDLGDGSIADLVKVSMSLAILFNYPLSFFPLARMLDGMLFRKVASLRDLERKKNILRVVLVAASCIFAISVSRFGAVTTLAGGFNGILAFVLPPLFYLRLRGLRKLPRWEIGINYLVMTFGVLGSIGSVINGLRESF